MEQMKYEQYRPLARTGDIALFDGKGAVSCLIKWFSRGDWSHVGLILRLDEWDCVLLWESTTLSDVADVESGKPRKGVQLVPLRNRIAGYDGRLAIRRIQKELPSDKKAELARFRTMVRGRPYEESLIELAKAAWDGPFGKNTPDLSSLFCSEGVAAALQFIGLIGESIPSNEYTPDDFGTDTDVLTRQAAPGWAWGPETLIAD